MQAGSLCFGVLQRWVISILVMVGSSVWCGQGMVLGKISVDRGPKASAAASRLDGKVGSERCQESNGYDRDS